MMNSKKKIMLLATGGTIASTSTASGFAPTLTAKQLLHAVPQLNNIADIDCKDVFALDSSNIQPEEWCEIAKAAYHALKDYDGVVITHGTDTLAYTAAAVSLMLQGKHAPVIFTGSQLPILDINTDARENLVSAVMAACKFSSGTYIVFRNKIINGTRASKTYTTEFDAFESINAPLAGKINAYGVQIYHEVNTTGKLCLKNNINPDVFLLRLIPGTAPEILDYVALARYRGIVIEAFGLGGLHYIRRNLIEKLNLLSKCEITILIKTQCLREKIDFTLYEVGHKIKGQKIFNAYDMTTEAAVTKLMWVLGNAKNNDEISKMLNNNYHDEISEIK